ncbi:hypothetical protein SMACR_04796 [Sordaria macrospora]|uniref:WGS project CABT00000000 data, contig 2.21 n=2 Tax=Sordaria macrospora TaxID=5147 RepID=F7W2G3_SORMK|nr:uncharacterized protein SMAC_04796 [Sordaria macrospora k-hell]KAA8636687.1 hypothetical protein SMACR_04796 [Sordaria macrospora]CCC11814.1 unnamed protein product [Sordaria macrospora k-hell]
MALPMAPLPKGPLGRYRLLSPTASVRVSPLCLGSMNFGDAWKDYMGECNQETTESILDFYYENGVIATKFTTNFRAGYGETEIMANFGGNGTKSMRTSVEASLRKLQTDYIDLLYVHWWDFTVSIPELMQSLNQLVTSGKVLYLGVSDTPAWVVSKANQYARDHGLRQFCVYQGRWSAASRDFERDIIPMCRDEGMGLAPWGALGGGSFKSEEQRQQQANEGRKIKATEEQIKISRALEKIAQRKNTAITSHLKGNVEALKLALSDQDIEEIEGAVPFDIGFPNSFLYGEKAPAHPSQVWLMGMAGTYDYVPVPKPIVPTAENGQ